MILHLVQEILIFIILLTAKPGAHTAFLSMSNRSSSVGMNELEPEADFSLPSGVEAKREWSYNS
jgi:hypothetical protein